MPYNKRHARQLAAGSGKEFEELRKLLVERIQNLETIVCGVDLELNQKLHKLLDEPRVLTSGAPVAPPDEDANSQCERTLAF